MGGRPALLGTADADDIVGFGGNDRGGTGWSLAQGIGAGRSDAFQAAIYAATRSGPAYLAASFAFANRWMSTDRYAAFGVPVVGSPCWGCPMTSAGMFLAAPMNGLAS